MIGEEVIAYYGDAGDGEELFEKSKLVRCKDCKYWKSEYICIGRWGWYGTMMTEADAFCSYGERTDE